MKRFVLILIGLMLVLTSIVQAGRRDDVEWVVDCNGFTSLGGSIYMNRDNTGLGRETIVITATDGVGTSILDGIEETTWIGLSLEFPNGVSFQWTGEPAFNPLTVRVYSTAGNGLEQQLVYEVNGACSLLDTAQGVTSAPTAAPSTGQVAAVGGTTNLNDAPPGLTNPDNVRATQRGYLVVDTSTANIRSGDGAQYTILGRVRGGEELIVLGQNAGGTWWFVEVGSVRGWISNELVVIRGDLGNVGVVQPQGQIFPPRLYTFRTNQLRVSPSLNAQVVCSIGGDLEYFIAGQNRDGSWLALEAQCGGEDIVGWIPADQGAIRNSGDLRIPVIPG